MGTESEKKRKRNTNGTAAVAVAKRRFLFARRDFYQLATHPWHDARAVP